MSARVARWNGCRFLEISKTKKLQLHSCHYFEAVAVTWTQSVMLGSPAANVEIKVPFLVLSAGMHLLIHEVIKDPTVYRVYR